MPGPIDRHTVDRLVGQHLPAALRLAQRLANDADTAEEMVQETLWRVLARWKSYRGEASFRAWMMQILVNVDRDRRRRRRDFDEASSDVFVSSETEPNERAAAAELGAAIRAAIHDLPDRQREVALLSFGEGMNARDVAYILETSETNVRTCVHLARKRIAKAIGVDYVRRK